MRTQLFLYDKLFKVLLHNDMNESGARQFVI